MTGSLVERTTDAQRAGTDMYARKQREHLHTDEAGAAREPSRMWRQEAEEETAVFVTSLWIDWSAPECDFFVDEGGWIWSCTAAVKRRYM